MLDQDYQLSAYKNLVAAGGLKTPPAITTSSTLGSTAKSRSLDLSGLILSDISYPSSISTSLSLIEAASRELDGISQVANSHVSLLMDNADLSTLLQLNLGWDVYRRAADLDIPELPISIAIGDNDTPTALLNAVNAVSIAGVSTAMSSINQTLSVSTGVGVPAPTLTQAQIDALTAACTTLEAGISNTVDHQTALQALYSSAAHSVEVSMAAYHNAVTTALSEAASKNPSTTSAVNALVPTTVMDELKKGIV